MPINKLPINDEEVAIGTLPVEPSFALPGELLHETFEMETIAGYDIVKSKHSRPIERATLQWEFITKADLDTLEAFFLTTDGPLTPFLFDSQRWFFKTGTFSHRLINPGVYSAGVEIEKLPTVCPVTHPTSVAVVSEIPVWVGAINDARLLRSIAGGFFGLVFVEASDKSSGIIEAVPFVGTLRDHFRINEAGEFEISLMVTEEAGPGFNVIELIKNPTGQANVLRRVGLRKPLQTNIMLTSEEFDEGDTFSFRADHNVNTFTPSGKNNRLVIKKVQ